MADESPRGVFLNDKQLVFVFMTATVVLVVVFLCGILVGRGVQTFRGMTPDGTMISTAQVVPDADAGSNSATVPPPGEAPPVPGSGETEPLTYAQALKSLDPPIETLPTPAGEAPPAPPEAPMAAAGPADETRPHVVQVIAVRTRDEADAIVSRLKRKGYAAFVFVPDGADRLAFFRVRIGPFTTRPEADAVARRLAREEGYTPWITR